MIISEILDQMEEIADKVFFSTGDWNKKRLTE